MIDTHYLNIPKHTEGISADPQFNVSDAVDILIETEMFFDILLVKDGHSLVNHRCFVQILGGLC